MQVESTALGERSSVACVVHTMYRYASTLDWRMNVYRRPEEVERATANPAFIFSHPIQLQSERSISATLLPPVHACCSPSRLPPVETSSNYGIQVK